MKLYFENSRGMRRLIGEPETHTAANKMVHDFCKAHNYDGYYIRNWIWEGELVYDVGSWSEFFYLANDDGTPMTLGE